MLCFHQKHVSMHYFYNTSISGSDFKIDKNIDCKIPFLQYKNQAKLNIRTKYNINIFTLQVLCTGKHTINSIPKSINFSDSIICRKTKFEKTPHYSLRTL